MSAHTFAEKYDRGHWKNPDNESSVQYVQSVREFAS
jgi:hypothetical protein